MIVGVPKEIKNNEYRVAMVPAGVRALTEHGHRILIRKEPVREPASLTPNMERQAQPSFLQPNSFSKRLK